MQAGYRVISKAMHMQDKYTDMHDSRPMNKIWGDEKALLLLSWMRKDDSIFMF